MRVQLWLMLACTGFATACAPTVNLATEKPIEITINLNHEVRIKLDRGVEDMLAGERQASRGIAPRGLDEDLQNLWADAGEVSAAKGSGAIGEQWDGYLGVPNTSEPKAPELVERANASRRSFYERLARENNAPLAEVEKLAGANRLRDAEVGDWILPPKAKWIQRVEDLKVEITE